MDNCMKFLRQKMGQNKNGFGDSGVEETMESIHVNSIYYERAQEATWLDGF